MRSLIIGNGAREHVIAERMAEGSELYAFMAKRNPGIAQISEEFQVGNLVDFDEIGKFADKINPDYIFVGPEEPLARGIVDELKYDVVGPTRDLARLEWDKGFCRKFLRDHLGRGYPKYAVCSKYEEAKEAIDELGEVAVKPSGLTAGKGVRVMGQQLKDAQDAKSYAKRVLEKNIGGVGEVVIEEKLEGEEFTLQAFTDGLHLAPMPLVQDHKHAYEGDTGPMTGGMGSYSDSNHLLPFLDDGDYEEALGIMEATIAALHEMGESYRGVLYGGFMLTESGPRLLEYNVRFGDPEAMNVLSLMKDDLSEVCLSIFDGTLKKVGFEPKATVCKYLVPRGYPKNPTVGACVNVDEAAIGGKGARIYYASVEERGGKTYTSTSRSLALIGVARSIYEAEEIAEGAISSLNPGKLSYRSDIGKERLIERRITHMREIRGL